MIVDTTHGQPMYEESAQQRQMEELLRQTEEETEQKFGPVRDIGMAILEAAIRSRNSSKGWIKGITEAKRLEREAYVFFEYVYFYTHLAMRHAFVKLTATQMGNVQSFLNILIPHVAIGSYFAHWPEELTVKMTRDFVDNLNRAEMEYTQAVRESRLEKSTDRFFSIFLLLASHITDLCSGEGQEHEPNLLVVDIALSDWRKMGLDDLMDRVSQTI